MKFSMSGQEKVTF